MSYNLWPLRNTTIGHKIICNYIKKEKEVAKGMRAKRGYV